MRLAGLRAKEGSLLFGIPAIQPDGSLSLVFLTRRHQGVVSTLPVGGVATLLCPTTLDRDCMEHVSVRVTHNTHVPCSCHVAMVTSCLLFLGLLTHGKFLVLISKMLIKCHRPTSM